MEAKVTHRELGGVAVVVICKFDTQGLDKDELHQDFNERVRSRVRILKWVT